MSGTTSHMKCTYREVHRGGYDTAIWHILLELQKSNLVFLRHFTRFSTRQLSANFVGKSFIPAPRCSICPWHIVYAPKIFDE